jgi:DNA-3-methyladenine glycosylase
VAILPSDFYYRPVLQVARDLLGMRLVRILDGVRVCGIINETEAYDGEQDLACHARSGLTPRTSIMYGPAGHAYVYFTYGMHWMLNIVTGEAGYPAAVLIRSIIPEEGLDIISARRKNQPAHLWCNGPAKLTQALGINGNQNGIDLCNASGGLFIESGSPILDISVGTTPRVGIENTPEPWRTLPWRFIYREIH